MYGKILIVALLFLAFGCVVATQQQTAVETEKPTITEPVPQPIEEQPKEVEIPSEPPKPAIETRAYTDPRGKITLEYPKTWTLKTETKSGSDSLTVEFVYFNYPDDKIRVNYAAAINTTLQLEQDRLKGQGTDVIKLLINGQEFLSYDTVFEPLPGKRTKERVAITIKNQNIFKIALTAKPDNFDALVPYYEVVLDSVEFPEAE